MLTRKFYIRQASIHLDKAIVKINKFLGFIEGNNWLLGHAIASVCVCPFYIWHISTHTWDTEQFHYGICDVGQNGRKKKSRTLPRSLLYVWYQSLHESIHIPFFKQRNGNYCVFLTDFEISHFEEKLVTIFFLGRKWLHVIKLTYIKRLN